MIIFDGIFNERSIDDPKGNLYEIVYENASYDY